MNERWQEDRNDDISKLFRENEGQLEERPSFRAWDRLERKLDSRRINKRKVMYRYTPMIAASVAILAMIFTIRFLDDFSTKMDGLAENTSVEVLSSEKQSSNFKTEELNEQNNNNQNSHQLPISTDSISIEPIAGTLPRVPTRDIRIADDIPAFPKSRDWKPNPSKNNTTNTSSVSNDRKIVNEDLAKKEEKTKPIADNNNTFYDVPVEEPTVASEMYAEDDEEYIEVDEIQNQSDKLTINSSGNPRIGRNKKEAERLQGYSAKDESKNSSPKEKTDEPTYSISSFNWMTGDWKDVSIEGSYDQWKKVKNGFVGNGYVIIGSDTSFVESMRIYKRGNDIYFEGSVDGTQKVRKFKLDNYENNVATFTRKSKSFPNQVIISHISNSSYMIVYENKDATKIDTKEELYTNYRNRMSSRRASRNMTRY